MREGAVFRLELFSRGGNPRSPSGRVFELPCPGLPADARLFGLIETDDAETTSILASLVRNALLTSETTNRRTLQTGLEGKFESILLAVNRGHGELAASGTIHSSPLPAALLGLVVDGELLLTGRGAVEALLFRPTEGTTPRNLFADDETRQASTTPFRTIVSGSLRPDDVLLVTTSKLLDYLAPHHLGRLLTSMPAAAARTRLLELLSDVSPAECLAGVILGAAPATPKPRPLAFVGRAASPPAAMNAPSKSLSPAALPARLLGSTTSKKRTGAALSVAGRIIQTIAVGIVTLVRRAFALVANAERRRQTLAAVRAAPDQLIERWNPLPRRSKLLIIAGMLLLLLFGQSVRLLTRNKKNGDQIRAYNDAVAAVQAKRDAAEASLIYKDEARARAILAEAEAAVRALPQRSATEKKTVADLLEQIESEREKTRHLTRLDTAEPIATLPNGSGAGRVLLAGKNLLTIVSDTGGAWNWDRAKKSLSPTIAPFLAADVVRRAFPGDRSPLYFTGKSLVERVATSTIKQTISLPTNASIAAAAFWNGRLYALTPAANQIYRGTKNRQQEWRLSSPTLKSPQVGTAVDLAIDGSLWTLEPKALRQYLAGTEQIFRLPELDPAPTALERIWTNAATDRLLLYDREQKRIYLLGKDGSFKAQFTGGPVDNLRDLAFDQKNKKLLILTDNALFETELPE